MRDLDRTPARRRLPATLRADCSRCAGLCCVADAFYAIQGFGFDKPARSACLHLTAENRCAIHARRASRGFAACVGFDCHGAGQRLTRELGVGPNWRSTRETAARVFAAYRTYLALHRWMAMLALAETAVAAPLAARARALRAELEELCGVEDARRGTLGLESLRRRVMELLREACHGASGPRGR
jgi:hypothetical protein